MLGISVRGGVTAAELGDLVAGLVGVAEVAGALGLVLGCWMGLGCGSAG